MYSKGFFNEKILFINGYVFKDVFIRKKISNKNRTLIQHRYVGREY